MVKYNGQVLLIFMVLIFKKMLLFNLILLIFKVFLIRKILLLVLMFYLLLFKLNYLIKKELEMLWIDVWRKLLGKLKIKSHYWNLIWRIKDIGLELINLIKIKEIVYWIQLLKANKKLKLNDKISKKECVLMIFIDRFVIIIYIIINICCNFA